MEKPEAILIAGPTASGKSGLALRLARSVGGVVVNADSMQVYSGLRILSARPSEAEMEGIEHRLYGTVRPGDPYSVGQWVRDVEALLPELRARDLIPVFCGGTGLYFRALVGGLDDLPAVRPEIRDFWRARMAAEGPAVLHRELERRDAKAAGQIRPSDPQRIVRALELLDTAGTPLAELRRRNGKGPVIADRATRLVIAPERPVLRERIARRFDRMVAEGALEEARRFAALPGAMQGLAAQAIGLAELLRHDAGDLTLGEARDLAVTRTRQYAKRQETWFRNQFGPDWRRLANADEG